MSMNETSSGERIHVAFFGRRNAGKSSLVNAVTNQNLSVVSDVKGTTTDPVKKSMEILPLGAVVVIDTPGIDDEGELGKLRVKKAEEILLQTDIAVLVTEAGSGFSDEEKNLVEIFTQKKIPFVIARNKSDLVQGEKIPSAQNEIFVSAKTGENVDALKNLVAEILPQKNQKKILSGLIKKGDVVVLVIPVDESAPKGRLILPQQETMREILDCNAVFVSCQPSELKQTLEFLSQKPALVVTDSQAFKKVSETVPHEIPLTSFSILFARYKGNLKTLLQGAEKISSLKDGDKILVAESCTHHRQCRDIGTVQLPSLIKNFCKKNVGFEFSSGLSFPENLGGFALVVHCGGCMINETQMKNRLAAAKSAGVPVVNYGMAIAYMNGILSRSTEIFRGEFSSGQNGGF